MVQLPCSDSLKTQFYKAFGPLTSCKPNVDQKEWPCTKSERADFFLMYAQEGLFEKEKKRIKNKIMFLVFSCLRLLCLYLLEHFICLSHCKIRWTMLVDNINLKISLWRTSNSMVTLRVFPWCKSKCSHDEFNSQSQILQGLGTTSWSMV